MKVLYIGDKIIKAQSGADQVNMRNQILLENIADIKYIEIKGRDGLKIYLSVSDELLKEIEVELKRESYDFVFIQQSTLGRACAYIKKRFPQVKILLFFHNIELQYAEEYLKTNGLRAIPFYLAVKYWEKKACKFADKFITLNSRDNCLLQKKYNKKSDLSLPTSMVDNYNDELALFFERLILDGRNDEIDYLFVGVAFFANIEGIQWFIDNVFPYVNGNLYIVGKGMDKVQFKNINKRVYIYGFVDDLSDFYYRARIVISPINVGGGMKTKTAEALMYGKTIVGTSEAFEGYELDQKCTFVCNTSKEFIDTIRQLNNDSRFIINKNARTLFLKFYESSVISKKLSEFLIKENKSL